MANSEPLPPVDKLKPSSIVDPATKKIVDEMGDVLKEETFRNFVNERLKVIGENVDSRLTIMSSQVSSGLKELKEKTVDAMGGFMDGIRKDLDAYYEKQKEALEKARPPVDIRVTGWDSKHVSIPGGTTHSILPELLGNVKEGLLNIFLKGPTQCGKTTVVSHLAKALNIPFSTLSISGGIQEYHLIGRYLPNKAGEWEFQTTPFIQRFTEGGIFLGDEADAADPNVLLAVNSAIANGYLTTPDGKVHHRNERFIMVLSANTWGTGPDAEYVGRNALDVATLERYVLATHEMDYDESLETAIAGAILKDEVKTKSLMNFVKALRKAIEDGRIRRNITTLFVQNAARALASGATMPQVWGRLTVSWTLQDLRKIPESLIPSSPKK